MKVVILNDKIPPEGRGGAEQTTLQLAKGLINAGHKVDLITTTEKKPFRDIREGIATHHLHANYPYRFRAWLSLFNPQIAIPLYRLLEIIRPDVLHFHNIHLNLSYASLSIGHRLKIPTVFTAHDVMSFAYGKVAHGIDPAWHGSQSPQQAKLPRFYNVQRMRFRYNPLRNPTIRFVLTRRVDARTCVSRAQQQALAANRLPPFELVYNGVDVSTFDAPNYTIDSLRQRFGLAGERVLLVAGRLNVLKGQRQILAALEQVITQIPNTTLLILSDRPLTWENADQAKRLATHVRSGGWLSFQELIAAYHLADAVVVPSIYFDPLPTVVLEAMAAAKPVVATCYGGAPEMVCDGETGYVINPFDTAAFADRLIQLLRDPGQAQQMGEAGRRRVELNFSLDKQVEHFTTLYRRIQQPV